MRRGLIAVVLVLTVVGVRAQAEPGRPSPCAGAASRDPGHPCADPTLRLQVRPSVDAALLLHEEPCEKIESLTYVPNVCAFGTPPAESVATIALLGDSHATAWRGAVAEAAEDEGWRAISLTRVGCPYSTEVLSGPPDVQDRCTAWFDDVEPFLEEHTQIDTVLVSAYRGDDLAAPQAPGAFAAKVDAFVEAFDGLPASIRHIVVLRDTPVRSLRTPGCIARARRQRRAPGPACALPRAAALRDDPEVAAAEEMDTPRVQVVDLSDFFCSATRCFPVVGGTLVHKDQHHLTRAFSRSLGPYLARELDQLGVPDGLM